MEDIDFSDDFCRFLQTTIPAVGAAELLLLLQRRPADSFSSEEAIAKLGPGISAGEALKYLQLFHARGLVVSLADNRYQYRPGNELLGYVDRLVRAYSQRPVTLIRIIYAFRDSKIKSFADAFKLKG
jgi:hypothetical protein